MKDKTIDSQVDKAAEAAKTSPRGMGPDKAHTGLKPTGNEPDVEVEEIFNNSPNNAGSIGNKRLK